jgi:hypothetical protein
MFVSDALTDFRAGGSAFNVYCIEISSVVFIEGDPILERVLFGRLKYLIFLDLIFLNFFSEDSFSRLGRDVLFTLGNL